MKITAAMVKELREKTGAGMLDCKKALEATEGNIEKAINYLRERGIAQAVKKQSRIAAEGLTSVEIKDNEAVLFELNSETDFVSKNDKFIKLVDEIGGLIINSNANSAEEALLIKDNNGNTINDLLVHATATIGEKISLRRVIRVKKETNEGFGYYKHQGGRISVLTVLDKDNNDVAKDISMHV
ncbi:MAG: translation elongation factor Ts, partial [Acholeplasmataceae bacterium]